MPVQKKQFSVVYDELQKSINVDDNRGLSVPQNMNFIESGYLTKDKGFELFGIPDEKLRHSMFLFNRVNSDDITNRYIISVMGTEIQVWDYDYLFTVDPSDDLIDISNNIIQFFEDDDPVQFTVDTGSVLPAPLVADTTYYVRDMNPADGKFKVALTVGGTAIDITTAGTGSFKYVKALNKAWRNTGRTVIEGAEMGWKDYDNDLYGCNGIDPYFKWDGFAYTEYTTVPRGDVLEVFEDRMFITRVAENPGGYYPSSIGDATTFDTADIIKPIGSDKAVSMKNYYGSLLLFKESTIWKMTYQYDQIAALFIPKLVVQSANYGACAKDAVRWVENDIWFFTGRELRAIGFLDNTQEGIYGVKPSVISESLKETLEYITVENFPLVKLFYAQSRVYLSVPIGRVAENNVVFVCHLLYGRSWTKYIGRRKASINSLIEVDTEVITTSSKDVYGAIKWIPDMLNDVDITGTEVPIASEVFFRRTERPNFNQYAVYRYLDLMFKDLIATIKVTIRSEAGDEIQVISKQSAIGNYPEGMENALGEVPFGNALVADSFGEDAMYSPFIKKKVSMLKKSQALIIGLSNNGISEDFTIAQLILYGMEAPPKQFSGRRIISIN